MMPLTMHMQQQLQHDYMMKRLLSIYDLVLSFPPT